MNVAGRKSMMTYGEGDLSLIPYYATIISSSSVLIVQQTFSDSPNLKGLHGYGHPTNMSQALLKFV